MSCVRATGMGIFTGNRAAMAVLSVCAALAVMLFTTLSAHADEQAEAFVQSLANDTIAIVSNDAMSQAEREAAFETLFQGNADINKIGAFTLGQYARRVTPEERATYLDLLTDFIVKVYLNRLSGYSNETVAVLGSQEKGAKGKEVIVKSQIDFRDNRQPLPVDWWLLRTDDGLKIFDVSVGGVWMAQEQRSSFVSIIRNNGGQVPALFEHMRANIEAGTAGGIQTPEAG